MSATKHVQNISGKTQEVVGFGHVEPDAVIEVPLDFHNANFVEKEVKKNATKKDDKND